MPQEEKCTKPGQFLLLMLLPCPRQGQELRLFLEARKARNPKVVLKLDVVCSYMYMYVFYRERQEPTIFTELPKGSTIPKEVKNRS